MRPPLVWRRDDVERYSAEGYALMRCDGRWYADVLDGGRHLTLEVATSFAAAKAAAERHWQQQGGDHG